MDCLNSSESNKSRHKVDKWEHDNHEVQPTPSIRKVVFKSQGQPFDQHLQRKDNREDPVHVVQHVLKNRIVLQVNVLKGLVKYK